MGSPDPSGTPTSPQPTLERDFYMAPETHLLSLLFGNFLCVVISKDSDSEMFSFDNLYIVLESINFEISL